MNTNHSPTPWQLVGNDIYAADGITLTARPWGPAGLIQDTNAEHRANADIIIRAVNSHAALVAALEAALPQIERHVCRYPDGSVSDNPALAQAKAALALAKGAK